VTAAIAAVGLGKRYGRTWALKDCTVEIPIGRISGLVGPNGAGKSTLLNLAVGLLRPTEGTIHVVGGTPAADAEQLGKVGFVAQDTPTYAGLSVADHLRLGKRMNPTWDDALATSRMADLGIDPKKKAGKLSGGQRAQLALTLAVAKRPEVLILDEPVASLDPLARREFLQSLTSFVAEYGVSVVLSSHLVADLERVCDHLVVIVESRVRLASDVDDLLASHRRLVGPRRDPSSLPSDQYVVESSHTDRQSTFMIRTTSPIHDPTWQVDELGLEDIVLAYMGRGAAIDYDARPSLEIAQ
jgi:ABC-2 type transport system ATP-binding protein